jgi:hypothetical protein
MGTAGDLTRTYINTQLFWHAMLLSPNESSSGILFQIDGLLLVFMQRSIRPRISLQSPCDQLFLRAQ